VVIGGIRVAIAETKTEKVQAVVGTTAGIGGSFGGVLAGAAIGTLIAPGVGTVAGGIIGGIAGSVAFQLGSEAVVGLVAKKMRKYCFKCQQEVQHPESPKEGPSTSENPSRA